MPIRSDRALRALEALKYEYGPGVGDAKREALQAARAVRLRTASQVCALHEVLCFWRAYPADRALLAEVERLLAAFGRRPDVRRHREVLLNSGMSGTDIVYPRCPSCGQTARLDVASRWMIPTLLAILLPNALLYGNFFYSGHLFVTSIFIILGAWGGLSWICFPVLSLERVATRSAIDRSKGLPDPGHPFRSGIGYRRNHAQPV